MNPSGCALDHRYATFGWASVRRLLLAERFVVINGRAENRCLQGGFTLRCVPADGFRWALGQWRRVAAALVAVVALTICGMCWVVRIAG